MGLTTITPPAAEVLTPADLRGHLEQIDGETDRDTLIAGFIAAARTRVENATRRRLITQQVRLTLDGFGCGRGGAIRLPVAPIASVAQVRYRDGAGDWQVMDPGDYQLVTSTGEPNELGPPYGGTWPVPRLDRDVVQIDLNVGYGDTSDDVPAPLLHAIRLLVAYMVEYREAGLVGARAEELPMGLRDFISDYILWV